jgi:DNA-binding transcriptional LysR family regulator
VRHADVILARLADARPSWRRSPACAAGGCARLVRDRGRDAHAPRIALFRERHPAVELSLEPAEPDEAIARLKDGECDVAMTIEAPFCSDRGRRDRAHATCSTTPMYVVLPQGHRWPQAAHPPGRAERRAVHRRVERRLPGHDDPRRACNAAGFEPRIAFHSDDYLAIQGFVAAGVGVSLIPDLALLAVRDDVVIRSLVSRAPTRTIQAATLKDGYRSPAVDAMLGILCEVGAEFAADRGRWRWPPDLAPEHMPGRAHLRTWLTASWASGASCWSSASSSSSSTRSSRSCRCCSWSRCSR